MPNNMKKAGMKYQKGGSKKKSETLEQQKKKSFAKKVDDTLEKATSGAINKIPAYKKAKAYVKNLMGMQKGGSMKKKYGHGGPMAKDYVGNPMGYFNDKAMYGKEMMKQSGGTTGSGNPSEPGPMKKRQYELKSTVGKTKPKRRTVTVNTTNPRAGTVGGSPVTKKTVTKRRGDKTITKTKSVRNPLGPGKSMVSKSKTVTKSTKGPMGFTQQTRVKDSGSNKSVSRKRGERMQSRMQSRKGATTTTPGRKRPNERIGPGPRPKKPRKTVSKGTSAKRG